MAKNKTNETKVNVEDFIESFVEQDWKKEESHRLIALMQKWSGFPPAMWGPSIIGFGSYHYKYESGHEGDAAMIGFSPRKAEFSLYVYMPGEGQDELLEKLGKYKMGKACIYVKRLEDIDLKVLEKICKASITTIKKKYKS